ncbi:MAG: hypothetical protein RMK29_06945 [Myxococcales bacterium]|nr:hypothetical protein [Myxococcota bacterium]MDW8281430.1 hypothetical protein [Myxococcales bacterium]
MQTTLAACALVVLLGCGAPSNVDLCHATCDSSRRCGLVSDSAAANCRQACENNRGALMDQDRREDRECRNAGVIRQQKMNCLTSDCNKVAQCLARVDGCIWS